MKPNVITEGYKVVFQSGDIFLKAQALILLSLSMQLTAMSIPELSIVLIM